MSSSVGQALLLTLLGAAGTALGGLLVVVQPTMSFKRLGMLQVGRTKKRGIMAGFFCYHKETAHALHLSAMLMHHTYHLRL